MTTTKNRFQIPNLNPKKHVLKIVHIFDAPKLDKLIERHLQGKVFYFVPSFQK